jgi:beta-glucanase (GH16 family)
MMERKRNFRAYYFWISLGAILLVSGIQGLRIATGAREDETTSMLRKSMPDPVTGSMPEPSRDSQETGAAGVQFATPEPSTAFPPEESAGDTSTGTVEGQVDTGEPGGAELEQGSSLPDQVQDLESQTGEKACHWEPTFEDSFVGEIIDSSRWDPGYRAGDKEAQYYVPDAFELEDGILRIRAEERQVDDRQYASGILTTQGKFDQQYGRFVIRAKVPFGQGLWPAFWMMPSSGTWPPEIDVFEILGHDTRRVYLSNRWQDGSGENTSETRGFYGTDFSEDFHEFEVEWWPEQIIWLVDGVERSRQTRGIPHEPMFLLVDLAVGGDWPGYPDESTPFPSYLEVDYVRAYTWTCPESNADEPQDEVQID